VYVEDLCVVGLARTRLAKSVHDAGWASFTGMLDVRAWHCPCGSTHDRDVNAAINVLAAGRAESLNDRGAHVRPTPVPAARREAVIHPNAACSTRSVEGISVPLGRRERQEKNFTSSWLRSAGFSVGMV
jgi:putative transposase